MSGLVEFLRARLNEDERTARAAHPSPWRYGQRASGRLASIDAPESIHGGVRVVILTDNPDRDMSVPHILRHDPARVLADVQAKRRILHEHRDDGDGGCYGCGLGNDEERLYSVDACPTKRALALTYAREPGYREEWRP